MRVVTSLLTLFTLAPLAAQSGAPVEVPADAGISIDGTHVPWSEFGAWLLRMRGNELLDEYSNERLLELEALRLGVEPGADEVQARVYVQINERIEKAFGGKREPWLAEIGRLGLTEEQYVSQRATEEITRLRGERILAERRIVSDSDVQQLFDQRYGRDGRRLWLRTIRLRLIVPTPPGRTTVDQRRRLTEEARAKLAERLASIRQEILEGKDFRVVAAEVSEDKESAARGGEFADSFNPSKWPTEVADVVYALEPGEISAPVFSNGFYSIFQTVKEEQVSYEELADELREELRNTSANLGEMNLLVRRLASERPLEARAALIVDGAPDDTVFTLGDEQVSRDCYSRWIARRSATSLVRPFVQEWLTRRVATAAGVEVSEELLSERLEALRLQVISRLFGGKLEKWHADLAKKGMDEDDWRRMRGYALTQELLAEKLIQDSRVVRPVDIKVLWETRYGKDGRRPDVRMIRKVVQLPPDAREKTSDELQRLFEAATKQVLAELEDVRGRAEEGEDFASLAERFSDDEASRAIGGRIPGGFDSRPWPEEVKQAVLNAQPGDLTQPFSVLDACFLFELTGVTVVPLEGVEKELRTELESAPANSVERSTWLAGLLSNVEWQLHPAAYR